MRAVAAVSVRSGSAIGAPRHQCLLARTFADGRLFPSTLTPPATNLQYEIDKALQRVSSRDWSLSTVSVQAFSAGIVWAQHRLTAAAALSKMRLIAAELPSGLHPAFQQGGLDSCLRFCYAACMSDSCRLTSLLSASPFSRC